MATPRPAGRLRRLLTRTPRAAGPGRTPEVELITRADCPLCEDMKRAVRGLLSSGAFAFREVDILSDAELVKRFALSIPVLLIDGEVAFEGRLTVDQLEARLREAGERTPGTRP